MQYDCESPQAYIPLRTAQPSLDLPRLPDARRYLVDQQADLQYADQFSALASYPAMLFLAIRTITIYNLRYAIKESLRRIEEEARKVT